jgi:hypothetical protein
MLEGADDPYLIIVDSNENEDEEQTDNTDTPHEDEGYGEVPDYDPDWDPTDDPADDPGNDPDSVNDPDAYHEPDETYDPAYDPGRDIAPDFDRDPYDEYDDMLPLEDVSVESGEKEQGASEDVNDAESTSSVEEEDDTGGDTDVNADTAYSGVDADVDLDIDVDVDAANGDQSLAYDDTGDNGGEEMSYSYEFYIETPVNDRRNLQGAEEGGGRDDREEREDRYDRVDNNAPEDLEASEEEEAEVAKTATDPPLEEADGVGVPVSAIEISLGAKGDEDGESVSSDTGGGSQEGDVTATEKAQGNITETNNSGSVLSNPQGDAAKEAALLSADTTAARGVATVAANTASIGSDDTGLDDDSPTDDAASDDTFITNSTAATSAEG